ncbi:MAG: hypothetical protein ACLGIF_11220 [Actinomycetes bacterium]
MNDRQTRTEGSDRTGRAKDPLQVYAEADEQTRAVIEKELDRIDALDQRDLELHARGLTYGVIITLAFLAACVFLIAGGHGVEGTTLGVMYILALVAVLVMGRRR